MKSKLTVLLTLALVFALSIPVMASPFTDVPADHWATSALKKVAKAGLINGYNDGTFKGQKKLSRYEVATLTAKVLTKIKKEDKEVTKDVAQAIEKLATEFDQELAMVDQRLDNLEAVQINGETGVEYKDITVEGGTAYQDPYTKDINGDDVIDDDDKVIAEDTFKQYADFNVNVAQDGVQADLDLEAVNNSFGGADATAFKLESISGEVATEDFVANIGDDQDLGWKEYLFAGEDNIDGVIFNAGNSTLALGEDKDGKTLAAKQANLFNLPVNVYAGADYAQGRNIVVGADTAFNLAGIDLTGEVATSDTELNGKLAKVGAKKDLGFVALEGNYKYVNDAFAPIQEDEDFTAETGYDLKATTNLDKVELAAKYEDYATQETTLTAKVAEEKAYNVYGVDVFGNYEYKVNSKAKKGYVEANEELGNVKLAAIYDYDSAANKSDKVMSVAYTPEFNVAGVKVDTKAKVAAIYDKNNNQAVNTEASVDATYQVNDKLTATAGYAWANKEDRVDIAGEKTVVNAGLDYQVAEDATATVSYETMNFTGADAADSFDAQSLKGQVNVKF
ncbi:putative S-layer protein [Halobacteroides halobius DSM 5150]|uniref:Putative S-layer protein n=1 Tax=Halobacteroides halobius (strain ATCC 35273 / DSM 5150 / MD-1) TaxID=748449 RepID=L0KBA9_HALHC|nr:S-layer homology domain-containing protein [Halobacteroides halobius]AGB42281.1 putative S-layer protein [Halobacteroides halobius DSM 5150]